MATRSWQMGANTLMLQVWDYASDGYVHRLVQSKTDGKLVEVPSPAQTTCGSRRMSE